METPLPWDLVPVWTQESLRFIGRTAAQVRGGVVGDLTKPGDDAWSIGCVFLNRWRSAITTAADTREELTIVDPSWHFVFAISGVSIRLWRAKGECVIPPERTRTRKAPELEMQQLTLPMAGLEREWFWRIRMITDGVENAIGFVLEQMNEGGETRNQWHIPMDDDDDAFGGSPPGSVGGPPGPTPLMRPPVKLPDVGEFEPLRPAKEASEEGKDASGE